MNAGSGRVAAAILAWLGRTPSHPTAKIATTGSTDDLYALGSKAFADGRFEDAAGYAARAASGEPGLPAVQYLLGATLLSLGRNTEAVSALEQALHGDATHPLSSHLEAALAMARARRDIALDLRARAALHPEIAGRRVSLIICSIDAAKLQRAVASYRARLGDALTEVIHIGDAASLCEGYNRGAAQAIGELLLFSHDDVEIISQDFSAKLFDTLGSHDFFGVAGSTQLAGPGWNNAGWGSNRGQVAWPHGDGRLTVSVFGPGGRTTSGVQVVDGLFFACRREVFASVKFDELNFDGWNLYDLDFCYAVWKAGFRTCVRADMLISHTSSGTYGPDWQRYADRFVAKWCDGIGASLPMAPSDLPQHTMRSGAEWEMFAQHLFDARDANAAAAAT